MMKMMKPNGRKDGQLGDYSFKRKASTTVWWGSQYFCSTGKKLREIERESHKEKAGWLTRLSTVGYPALGRRERGLKEDKKLRFFNNVIIECDISVPTERSVSHIFFNGTFLFSPKSCSERFFAVVSVTPHLTSLLVLSGSVNRSLLPRVEKDKYQKFSARLHN